MSDQASVLLDDVAFLLVRASAQALSSGSAALRPLGLSVRAYATLALACERDGITQRDIATFLSLDPSRVVALVDELEAKGLVARRTGSGDRRVKLVVATDEGRGVFTEAHAAVLDAQHQLFGDPDPAEREASLALLRALAFPAPAPADRV